MRCAVTIVGPTGVGKSAVALRVARAFNGEIINADSRQIYKYMDVGTAKPGIRERSQVPHHLFDIICPDEPYSVALYQRSAFETIERVHGNGGLPILVGGSGQYVWSAIEGWNIPEVPPAPDLRAQLLRNSVEGGPASLHRRLAEIDPQAAVRIDPSNVRRVIRALEIHYLTGRRPSDFRVKIAPPYPFLILGVTCERGRLYARIDERVDAMISSGFVEETRNLLERGYSSNLPSLSSLGYRELARYLKTEMTLSEAVQKIKFETHRFARSQYTWFRLNDERIQWMSVDDDIDARIDYTIQTFLRTVETEA